MAEIASMTVRFLAGAWLFVFCSGFAFAQQPSAQPSDAARTLVGVWELSNPDRDRRCTLTFKLDPAPQGRVVTLGPTCAAAFPDVRPTAAWTRELSVRSSLIFRCSSCPRATLAFWARWNGYWQIASCAEVFSKT